MHLYGWTKAESEGGEYFQGKKDFLRAEYQRRESCTWKHFHSFCKYTNTNTNTHKQIQKNQIEEIFCKYDIKHLYEISTKSLHKFNL